MDLNHLLFSPPVLVIFFMLLGGLIIVICRHFAAKDESNPEKYIHYSCGEDLDVPHFELNYHAFFQLSLLFGILHIVALIISTAVSTSTESNLFSVVYVIGAAVCMFILLENDEK